MLGLGIDEITLVLQMPSGFKNQISPFDWRNVAENIIYRFVEKSDFNSIFGNRLIELNLPNGYTSGYTYGDHSFYLAVAYHQYQIDMGVVVKFSAQALAYYCEKSGLKVYEFLQKVRDNYYSMRLSRIDLTADYIDEGIDITQIYQSLMDKKIGVFREKISKKTGEVTYLRCDMRYQGFIIGREVPTVYLGSIQSNSRLRIYDKRREQIERNGLRAGMAMKCKDWVRFEGVFRHEFAHQLTDELLKIKTDDEFANLIAWTLVQKFRLMYIDNGVVDCDTEYTQMLLDCINNTSFILKTPSSRNDDLARSLSYLLLGSGLLNTLCKIKAIWGNTAIDTLMRFITDCIDEWEPNDDCNHWIVKNKDDYRVNFPDFEKFLDLSIAPRIK